MVSPSVFLSGIGEHSCWIVDENTRLLRVWNMNKPFWQRTAPRMAQIPHFTEEEGLPLFVAELGPGEESLAFCTKNGAVSSLDHSVEFTFYSEEEVILVSSFACRHENKVMLTAVGTVSGMVLIAVKVDGERFVLNFDRFECQVEVRKTPLSLSSSRGKWWPTWLLGKSWSSENSTASHHSTNADVFDEDAVCYEFTLLRFRAGQTTQLWAVNAASEIFLLDFAPIRRQRPDDDVVRAEWATNLSEVLQRQCRVAAFDETESQLCCLVYLMPCDKHEASLEVVTLDSQNGAVRQTLSIQSVGSLTRSVCESPLHHTKLYIDEVRQEVMVLSGHYCVRLNNRVSVRSPCSSEDVLVLRGVERALGSSLMPDGRIVTLDINGPIESVAYVDEVMVDATTSSTELPHYRDAWRQSHFTGKYEGASNMARHVDGILRALRIDSKMSLDSAVLEVSEGICSHLNFHEGNWARADLDVEDDNMVMYITQNLVRRQQEHRRFLLTVLLHKEIGPCLQAQTIAQLLSVQESLLAMVAIRRLQNDSSYPLSATTDVDFEVLTPIYRHAPTGTRQPNEDSTVEEYFRLVRNSFERELCQRLLREAVIHVANSVRGNLTSTQPLKARATAAEIVFGDPSRLSILLQTLGERLCETQRSVLVDHRTKFEEAMALANIFVLVLRAVNESRNDMASFYAVPHNVRMMLWTSSELEQYGIQLQMASACTTLSNTLAEAVATSMMPTQGTDTAAASLWNVSVVDQLRLLDLVAILIHFVFQNHSQGNSSFYADVIRCTLFREPFFCEPLGYPFGSPRVSADSMLGSAVLRICEELALEFNVGDILLAICLADPVEDPLREKELYKLLGVYCRRNPHMYEFALRSLLAQRREWELQLLPDLLPDYEPGTVARDMFLEQEAPQLAWIVKPTAFEALIAEGVRSSSYLAYGEDLVTHRSRCLSMSKLAWVAAGAPTSATYHAMRLDEAIVVAQKACLLPETKNVELGPAEIVQRLLKLSSLDAWVHAARVASLVQENLSEDLLTQVIRRAKLHDGEALLNIMQDGTSELEIARALEETAIGRILTAMADQQTLSIFDPLWSNVLDNEEQKLLSSWIQMRAAGLVT